MSLRGLNNAAPVLPPEAALRRASSRLLGMARSGGTRQQEQAATEAAPLLSRRGSEPRGRTRASFQIAREEAVGEAVQELTCLRIVATFFAMIVLGFFLYIEIRSLFVLLQTSQKPCDMPLWGWLFVRAALVWLMALCAQANSSVRILWVLIGYQWLTQVRTCGSTDPELFLWVKFVILFDVTWITVTIMLQFLFLVGVITFVYLVENGYIPNPRAARPETIELLKRVPFREDLFAAPGDERDSRPARECSCCFDEFNAETPIVMTPCKHYYHEACLADWLKLARTCPLCRCDLDEATQPQP